MCIRDRFITLSATLLILSSCGVKHKKAGDVGGIFSIASADIKEKVENICTQLNLKDGSTFDISELPFQGTMCSSAGDIATNLGSGNFKFTNVSINEKIASADGPQYSEYAIKLQAQVWLNKNIEELITSIITTLLSLIHI